jgi:ArsR family transcriptional regulator
MKKIDALAGLAGLAHETRLDIFRLLIEAGPAGMPAGEIGARLGLPPPTLSFHLKDLKSAGLIDCERDGRSLIYSADFGRMNALIAYLTENCCGRKDKATAASVAAATETDMQPQRRRRAGRV